MSVRAVGFTWTLLLWLLGARSQGCVHAELGVEQCLDIGAEMLFMFSCTLETELCYVLLGCWLH
jgi:hypothetical protein